MKSLEIRAMLAFMFKTALCMSKDCLEHFPGRN